jgi:NAD(P)-dependent dehydrogenase (short-subunit alcohol dehydrogenase family)
MRVGGKVVLVTGAGRGIGQGLAVDFAREGARVAVHYFNEEKEAEATCALIRSTGGEAAPFQADLAVTSHRERLFTNVIGHFGRLDVLVNNAGFDPGDFNFLAATEEQFDAVIDVNLKGLYFCAQAAARQMILQKSGGKIINISSIQGQLTFPDRTAYAASKGGVDALTRALALDLGPHRIQVNAIAPGFIEVERNKKGWPGYTREEVGRRIPVGRVGFPSDISALAIFLASPESDYITGQVLVADGGSSAQMKL